MDKHRVQIGRANRGAHLILTGYAHWLPSDPRGSGSADIRKPELRYLGEVHPGRKRLQPTRQTLREFHQDAQPLLAHPVVWFDEAMRESIATGVAGAAERSRYTIWACAVLTNHLHLVVRTHRDRAETMLTVFGNTTAIAVRAAHTSLQNHPIWSDRPYKVFLRGVSDVRGRIEYVEDNPPKEGLPRQSWSFVRPCKR